jgi:hypothetical protein
MPEQFLKESTRLQGRGQDQWGGSVALPGNGYAVGVDPLGSEPRSWRD